MWTGQHGSSPVAAEWVVFSGSAAWGREQGQGREVSASAKPPTPGGAALPLLSESLRGTQLGSGCIPSLPVSPSPQP